MYQFDYKYEPKMLNGFCLSRKASVVFSSILQFFEIENVASTHQLFHLFGSE